MVEPLNIIEPAGFGLATVLARKGRGAEAISRATGIPAGTGPGAVSGMDLTLIGTGPGVWLAFTETAGPAWCHTLAGSLHGVASVSDQSGGYVIFRLSGPQARLVLQRGAAIDLHPDVFARGSSAATVISHMSVWFWQRDEAPTYDIAVFRSFADSFRHWLHSAVAAL